ncbi:MAG: hypothetical protein HRU09_15110 [Oligoflexales bacterium]|nr:hypothetical protein [Oligoflexales bacterium]
MQGNSNVGPDNSCAADPDDSKAYVNGNCEGRTSSDDPENRRTHVLSNQQVIWDLAGNVWDWTKETITYEQQPSPIVDGYVEYTEVAERDPSFPVTELIPQLVIDSLWDSGNGIGDYRPREGNGDGIPALRRGGDYDTGDGGIFSARFSTGPNSERNDIGFRCVRVVP